MAGRFPIGAMCRALGVSRSGYYAHAHKPSRPRRVEDERLRGRIRESFTRNRGSYGSPRIAMEMRREGERCGKNRVARLMCEQGLRAKCKRRWRPCTTRTDPALAVAPNVLAQVPSPCAPDQVWVGDITYLPTREGWHFLAVVMDLFTRRIVGWATAPTLHASLVGRALARALALRGHAPPGLIHHSDRGCQYASATYRQALRAAGITASMSRKGNCYDNAAMESFFATLKTEVFNPTTPESRRQAELMVFDYIETYYNPRRIHSALGYASPIEFETAHRLKQPMTA